MTMHITHFPFYSLIQHTNTINRPSGEGSVCDICLCIMGEPSPQLKYEICLKVQSTMEAGVRTVAAPGAPSACKQDHYEI